MFDDLMQRFDWRPIPNCPGRYRLDAMTTKPEEICGFAAQRHELATARDPVWVARFDDGSGLISYERKDGTFVHTLNTPEGFARKIENLGIRLFPS